MGSDFYSPPQMVRNTERHILLMLAMSGCLAAGCGGSGETTESATGTTASGPTTDGETADTTTTTSNTTDPTAGPSGSDSESNSETDATTDPGMPTEDPTDATTDPTDDSNTVTTNPAICDEGEEQCKDGGHEVCMNGEWTPAPCADGEYCDEQQETCLPCACTPGEQGACVGDSQIETCNEACSEFEPVDCPLNNVCVDDACVNLVCPPGQPTCVDDDTYQVCNDNGTDYLDPVDCGQGEVCQSGQCVSACEAAAQVKSNIGCEFWASDMDNLPPRDRYVYAVTVSNPSFTDTTNVEIWDANGNEQMIITDTVAPREVKVFNLSGAHGGFTSHYNGQDSTIQGSGIVQGRAFRIVTDLPVLATQFNPIGGATGHTTDASLLLPTHTLGQDYIHAAWTQGHGNGTSMNIVGTEDNTTVTITPTINTPAGQNGLPAMTAGQPTNVTINRYDIIQVTAGLGNTGLTGSRITSTAPVAVFGGHSCADVPTTSTSACDHIEEQIFPLETWGKDYIALRNPARPTNNPENVVWRIIAAEDNTTVTFDPPVSIGSEVTLNSQQFVQFEDKQYFHITADDPILVVSYMIGCTGSSLYPGLCDGDPYMVQMVSTEQYLDDYVFHVDSSYDRDFADLVRPTGAAVDVGCLGVVPENRWTPIGDSGFDWATINMNPGEADCMTGTNEASSDTGFGIVVSGRANAASYAYPGGLGLAVINPQ